MPVLACSRLPVLDVPPECGYRLRHLSPMLTCASFVPQAEYDGHDEAQTRDGAGPHLRQHQRLSTRRDLDERGHQIVLDRRKVDQYSQRILERYRITADRSKDLKSLSSNMSQQQRFDPANTVVQMGREK